MHAADDEAFRDHYGYSEHPFDHWLHYVSQPFFRPDLTVVAEDAATGEVAGFCTIVVNGEENKRIGIQRGWIDILGVRRPWRKRGLGTALLLKCLRDLRGNGLVQAALGCDSENVTGATRIYDRVGFAVAKTRAAFSKAMRGANDGNTNFPRMKMRLPDNAETRDDGRGAAHNSVLSRDAVSAS
jgi:ribosomal protein S18 acetylase RimI-like enzyme